MEDEGDHVGVVILVMVPRYYYGDVKEEQGEVDTAWVHVEDNGGHFDEAPRCYGVQR